MFNLQKKKDGWAYYYDDVMGKQPKGQAYMNDVMVRQQNYVMMEVCGQLIGVFE